MRPSTTLASVTVATSPPRPYAAGPGSAPADIGPTRSAPPWSTHARLPPPAPMVLTGMDGTRFTHPAPLCRVCLNRPAGDAADIGRGTAHVEADDRLMAFGSPDGRGGHHPGGRTRQDEAPGLRRSHREGEQTSRGGHRESPSTPDGHIETGQVAGQLRRQVGVEDGRRDPLVLPELGRDQCGHRDRGADPAGKSICQIQLLRRVHVGPYECDGNRLRARGIDHSTDRLDIPRVSEAKIPRT